MPAADVTTDTSHAQQSAEAGNGARAARAPAAAPSPSRGFRSTNRSHRLPCAGAHGSSASICVTSQRSGAGGRIDAGATSIAHAAGERAPAGRPARSQRCVDAERTDEEAVPVIGLRRKIAQKMQESKRRIPHFTYVEEVDVTELGGAARAAECEMRRDERAEA